MMKEGTIDEQKELAKAYEPREVEDQFMTFGIGGGYFHAVDPEEKALHHREFPLRILRDGSMYAR